MNEYRFFDSDIDEMRAELKRYLQQAHTTKKHIEKTARFLRAKSREALKSGTGDWDLLSKGTIPDISPVTGPEIKSAFRRYIVSQEQERCCYCRKWLPNIAHARPIEHVLPRHHYPRFTFYFWNLAVSCFDCNSVKKDQDWGGFSKTRQDYPAPSEFTKIFHPGFHSYEAHVRYIRIETNTTRVVLYKGITTQGKHLCKELLNAVAAREVLRENNPAINSAMKKLEAYSDTAEEIGLKEFAPFLTALMESISRPLKI